MKPSKLISYLEQLDLVPPQCLRQLNDLRLQDFMIRACYRDTVLLNTSAALIVAGKAQNLRDGVAQAAGAIASGAAYNALQTMRRATAD